MSVIDPNKIQEFKDLVIKINNEHNSSEAGSHKMEDEEKQAFLFLSKFYADNDFDASKSKGLIDVLKRHAKYHAGGWTDMKLFQRLCMEYYTMNKETFLAFQKAMGGRQQRQQDQSQSASSQSQPRTTSTPQQSQPQTPPAAPTIPHGHERLDFNNGDYYIGVVRNGVPNGQGKYFYKDGSWKSGMFIDGKLTDKNAVVYWSRNQITDRGEYTNDNRTGSGRIEWENGSWYQGEWTNKGQHGMGVSYNVTNKRTDTGQYKNGNRSGSGKMEWANGDWYEGTWEDTDKGLQGKGIFHYADGRREKCKYVDGKYVATGFDLKGLTGFGAKVWDSIPWWPWVIYGIYLIIALFTKSFWGIVGVAIFGAIGASIAWWVLVIGQGILEAIREFFIGLPKWLRIGFWILIAALIINTVWKNRIRPVLFPKTATEQVVKQTAVVTAKSLNLRSEPKSNAPVIHALKKGNVVTLAGEASNGWIQVEYEGAKGFVSTKYIELRIEN